MKRLGDLVERVQSSQPTGAEFLYVDLSAVDSVTKTISNARPLSTDHAPSRARQVLRSGDVLVSTVRPNLNSVAAVPQELDGAIASTGFTVLRPKPEEIDSRYLFHWVRTDQFVAAMVQLATGASYPAVSDVIVKASEIPLPPLPEQRRIASILDQADQLQAMNRRALSSGRDLDQESFYAHFAQSSDVTGTVADVLADVPNAIRTGPFGSQLLHSEFASEGVAVLGIDSTLDNDFHDSGTRFITEAKYQGLRRYTVQPGDVLVTIMGTIGRTAVVPKSIGPAINTKHLCCITTDKAICLPEYLQYYFLYHPIARNYLARASKGSIMDGLNMGLIRSLPIVLPNLREQERFVSVLSANRSLGEVQKRRATLTDELFASLQHRAFSGQL